MWNDPTRGNSTDGRMRNWCISLAESTRTWPHPQRKSW